MSRLSMKYVFLFPLFINAVVHTFVLECHMNRYLCDTDFCSLGKEGWHRQIISLEGENAFSFWTVYRIKGYFK